MFQLFATGVVDTGCKFTAGVVDTSGKLPPLSLTPAANLKLIFSTPVANLPPVSTTSAVLVEKFAAGVPAGSVQLSEESHRVKDRGSNRDL